MKKMLFVSALAIFITAFAPLASADIVTELVLSDGFGDKVTLDVSSGGVLTVTCNSGACGNMATAATVDKAHGTITVTSGTLGSGVNTFLIDATGVGGSGVNLPTLQDLNQIDATAGAGGGVLTSLFTDTAYANMSATLNVANSETTDIGIAAASSSDFKIFTSASGVPAVSLLEDDTLVGHSNNNGVNGVNFANPNHTGSLSTETILSFSGAGRIQANDSVSNVAAVPEPASVFLFGGVFVAVAGALKKRRKGNAV
jgi:hypothetical protein